MIGVFSYTVILTYISLIIGIIGIFMGFIGNATGSVICLLLCGLLDMLDGKVARTKKNRTVFEKNFGVQIDSLNDLVCFGILPIIVGLSLNLCSAFYIPIYAIFVLTGLIRLAYFNTLTQSNKGSKEFIGLPITTIALIVPIIFLLKRTSCFIYLYPFSLLIVSMLYVLKIKIKKPDNKLSFIIGIIGFIEFLLVLFIN